MQKAESWKIFRETNPQFDAIYHWFHGISVKKIAKVCKFVEILRIDFTGKKRNFHTMISIHEKTVSYSRFTWFNVKSVKNISKNVLLTALNRFRENNL